MRIIVVAAFMLLAGCSLDPDKFVYPYDAAAMFTGAESLCKDKTVMVMPFEDCRGTDNSFKYPMGLIPLMPYGWGYFDTPEHIVIDGIGYPSMLNIEPTIALAKAANQSIRRSGMFKKSFFSREGNREDADYFFYGKVCQLHYNGRVFTYGLSIFGRFLWLILPTGTSEDILSVEFRLCNKTGRTLWEYSYADSDFLLQWIYYGVGKDTKAFAELYQDAMNKALASLEQAMKENPTLFK